MGRSMLDLGATELDLSPTHLPPNPENICLFRVVLFHSDFPQSFARKSFLIVFVKKQICYHKAVVCDRQPTKWGVSSVKISHKEAGYRSVLLKLQVITCTELLKSALWFKTMAILKEKRLGSIRLCHTLKQQILFCDNFLGAGVYECFCALFFP